MDHIGCLPSRLTNSRDLSIFCIKDGSCIITTQVEHPPLQSAAEVDPSHKRWIWTSLQVLDIEEVREIRQSFQWALLQKRLVGRIVYHCEG
jgi:hypothetical protein